METTPGLSQEPPTVRTSAPVSSAPVPGVEPPISTRTSAVRTTQRWAGIMTFLLGPVLLSVGVTGCGDETSVSAAESSHTHHARATVQHLAHDGHDDAHGGHDGHGDAHDGDEHHEDGHGDTLQADEHQEQEEMMHGLSGPACPLGGMGVPEKPTAAERRLYLTPGGRYTAEDIAMNGPLLPSQRFRGIESKHDLHPQPGARLCPVTGTRASPRFTWIVGGKAYQFCCPPCIDEFVRQAKERPQTIRPPDDYVKH